MLRVVDEECFGDASESKSTLTVASMLSLLTGVKTLSFSRSTSDTIEGYSCPRKSGSWVDFSPSLKEAIANLFRSPSLKDLTVASFDSPLSVLLPEGAEIDTCHRRCFACHQWAIFVVEVMHCPPPHFHPDQRSQACASRDAFT